MRGPVRVTAASVANLLALSDERDTWERRVNQAYRDGYNAGRADACVAIADIEHHREARQLWNQWWAKVQRIIQNTDHPDMRIRQAENEIAADQLLVAGAKKKRPDDRSPLEYAVLNRIRGERFDENEAV